MQVQAGDKLWTLAMGGLHAVVLSTTPTHVTVQLFNKPMHIRTVPNEMLWCFHKELTTEEEWDMNWCG